ncbi:nitroreductase family deazaflavin-dependent oxidoreductase [Gordonia sp. NPDC003504]
MGSPYPDVRWGSESSSLRAPLVAFAKTKPGSWVIRTMTPLDRALMKRSHGRFTTLGPIAAPTALVTTIGRKSGERRTSPLLYYREDPHIFLIGSNFGQEHHPAWTWNLLADPRCWVTIGDSEIASNADLLDGEERDRVFGEMANLIEVYGEYRPRTDREIRVFRLTAV